MTTQSEVEGVLDAEQATIRFRAASMPGFGKSSWPIGVAVKEDSRDPGYAVDDIIAGMVINGRMQQIFAKRGVTYRAPTLE